MDKKQSGFRYVFGQAYKNDKMILLVLLMQFCFRTLAPLVLAFTPMLLINTVVKGLPSGQMVLVCLLLLLFGIMAIGLNSFFENLAFFHVEKLRSEAFTTQFLKKLLHVKYSYLEDQTFQNLVYSGYGVVNNERTGCSAILNHSVTLLSALVDIAVFALYLIRMQNIWMLASMIVVIGCNLLMAALIGNITYKNEENAMQAERKMNYYNTVCLGFDYAKEVRSYPIPGFAIKKYKGVFQVLALLKRRESMKITLLETLMLFILVSAESLFYLFVLYQNISQLNISNLFLILSIFMLLPDLVGQLINDAGQFFMAIKQTSDLTKMLSYEDEPAEHSVLQDKPLELNLRGVTFHYPGNRGNIIKDISFQVPQCKKIALVGKNGSGKTTLIKLLLKLYDTYEGTITLGDRNLKDIPKQELYGTIGGLFQNSIVFASRIWENVVLNEEFEEDRFIKAMECAGLLEKLESLPDGMNTLLNHQFSEEAVDLSGGEKQKLLFARILYMQPKIVILDEPTAAMDVIAEERFYSKIKKLLPQSTIIFITHRLSSTKFCDAIYVMDEGRIVESGTHAQLLEQKGVYYEMYRLQSKYYQKEYGKVLKNE